MLHEGPNPIDRSASDAAAREARAQGGSSAMIHLRLIATCAALLGLAVACGGGGGSSKDTSSGGGTSTEYRQLPTSRIRLPFGATTNWDGGPRSSPHNGTDITGAVGDPLLAAADGTISHAKENHGGCGTFVGLVPKGGSNTVEYCHLQSYTVGVGSQVKRGDVVGYIGMTGETHSPHLHVGLWIGGNVDPVPYMVGCFESGKSYSTDPLALTWPVQC